MAELSRMYGFGGQEASARALQDRVLEIDPLSLITHAGRLLFDYWCGHPVRHEAAVRQMLRTAPGFSILRFWYVMALVSRQRIDEARAVLEAAPEEQVPTPCGRMCRFFRHALDGRRDDALASFNDESKAAARRVEAYAWQMAECYAFVDELDEAMDWLETAVDRGFTHYPYLSEHAVILNKLRAHARYDALMKNVKYAWEHFEE